MSDHAESPFGSSLLDKSKANPANVNMDIFKKNASSSGASSGNQPLGQGTVNNGYLQQCREDNPDPETQQSTDSASLTNCKILTDPAKLATNQPFEMSVDIKGPEGATSGSVTFSLFCCVPKPDGTEENQDQSATSQGQVKNGTATAKGKLFSPKQSVDPATKLKYYVVAQHPKASEKAESPKVEVEAGKVPDPLAIWSLGAVHFGFDSSFILPTSADDIAKLKQLFDQNAGAAATVFGHADPVGDDDPNKTLSGRRAFSTYCLLTRNVDGWTTLSKGVNGDQWGVKSTQTILAHLKDDSGSPYLGGAVDGIEGPQTNAAVKAFQKDNTLQADGIAGSQTKAKLYAAYMDDICSVSLKPSDFVGDPNDEKRQWACSGCSEFNPVLVFSKADDDGFKSSDNKTERNIKNAPNRRATVALFPETAKGPGNVTFPCPAWSDGADKCKAKFFDDADTRRNPGDAERTWEKDKDTFACKFYAGIAKEEAVTSSSSTNTMYHSL